jgi:DNA repair protein RadC
MKELPQDERPREKLRQRGAQSLSDAELLAIFLGTGSRDLPVLTLARQLLHDYQTLYAVVNAPFQDLSRYKGIGLAKYIHLQASLELARRYLKSELQQAPIFQNAEQAKQFCALHLESRQEEVFAVIFLNNQNALLHFEILFSGTLNQATVYPREVLKKVIYYQAANVILTHNHPSGSTKPSDSDCAITKRLQDALALIEVKILDHLIVGKGKVFSFAENGLL